MYEAVALNSIAYYYLSLEKLRWAIRAFRTAGNHFSVFSAGTFAYVHVVAGATVVYFPLGIGVYEPE